uniref:Uncharacterized protein n=1 Tax=Oryza brachyantha TaxID=4533 RepID=J3MS21_ORYBR
MVKTCRSQAPSDEDTLSPAPATSVEVMAMQTQPVQVMVNNQRNRESCSLGEFMSSKPPTFTGAEEPMDPEDCLCKIDKKLTLVLHEHVSYIFLLIHYVWHFIN